MNHPTPAIVTQAAARRFPRSVLLLFCAAYVLSGFIGRDAWRSADMVALGYMGELVQGSASWFKPSLMGLSLENPSLLPYWLGAWAIHMAPSWMPLDFAARIPFGLMLALALVSTWYGTYYLARSPKAQPVAFAFGGEALPTDYARAIADGGLLALMACLGLAQLSHETTPALAQLSFTALLYYAISALPYHRGWPALAAMLGLCGLTLSGAPAMAVFFGLGSALVHGFDRDNAVAGDTTETRPRVHLALEGTLIVLCTALVAAMAFTLNLWRWKIELPHATWTDWNGYAQLLIWFTWPAWPLALWTGWRWRHQLFNRNISRHLTLPAWFSLVCVVATLTTGSADRTLLLALPALASLAAFALPTLKRQMASLIDWFTLLFFSGCGFTIWVVWIAMQTGYPSQPAANVARLAPGFEARFSTLAFGIAIAATLAWAWLVKWRVGRHRAAIWKSLVLPAGGAGLCWLLLMTLWMPLLNYAQSYVSLVNRTVGSMGAPPACIETTGLGEGTIAALQFYGKLPLKARQATPTCPWLLAEPALDMSIPQVIDTSQWDLIARLNHPVAREESLLIFKRH
ncbi:MAG: hypothetical protein Q8R67_23445 [Rhodoferax sp.]|nr:hypothetical protein [Rhodoferax sp.]MDP3654628.1 hypothetical protein [Rhodoferax sp.]